MSAFFNSDGSFPLQFIMIFAVIFVVLAAIVLAFRRFSGKGLPLSSKSGPRGRQPRLGIVDIYELDRQRQLILLRRDNVEHLLLVGGPNDVIVERNINRGAGVRAPLDEAQRVEPPTEEPIFEPARPAGPPLASAPPMFRPSAFEVAEIKAPEITAPDVVAPSVPADAAATRRDEPAEAKANARPSRAEVIAARAARRNPPPLANLKAELPERQRPQTGRDVEPTLDVGEPSAPDAPTTESAVARTGRRDEAVATPASSAAPPALPLPMPPPPVSRPASPRPVDAAILSDMARQLEEALRRPSAAVSPASPAVPVPAPKALAPSPLTGERTPKPRPDPAPQRESAPPVEPLVDPMAAAMAVTADVPALPEERKVAREPSPPEPAPFLPSPPPPPAPEAAPRKPALASQNPFSVEEIEAEFARLLGRPLDKKG